MSDTLTFPSPAKLNLTLRILGRRSDGYHKLDTVMTRLPGLADTLEFTPAETFQFSCDDPSIPDEENLVVLAARAYEAATKLPCQYRISLKKTIPHGAGLGGGSSNAATTLLALNQFNGTPLEPKALAKIASSLGSDIPFFLTPGPSRCAGRGEIVQTAKAFDPLSVLLLKPAFSVSTRDAYNRYADSLGIPNISYRSQQVGKLKLINHLERPVFEKHRFLAELKQWLIDRPETQAALMSGSGSTIFAVLQEDADAATLTADAHRDLDPGLWHWAGTTEPSSSDKQSPV